MDKPYRGDDNGQGDHHLSANTPDRFTQRAREAKAKEGLTVVFRDVKEDVEALAEMLRVTQGGRQVPVMVEGEKISIGFGGS